MNLTPIGKLLSLSPGNADALHQFAHNAIHELLLPIAGAYLSAGVRIVLNLMTTALPRLAPDTDPAA